MKTRYYIPALLLAMAGIVFALFWPTLSADFLHWDDDINVFENPHVQALSVENLRWMFTDFEQAIRYKALSWLAWAVVHELFGLNPFGYHLANVLLHTLNAGLVFFLLLRLVPDGAGDAEVPRLLAATVATLLWVVHPLRVEPVAWVTGLPYHLSLSFLLVATLCYLWTDFTRSVWRQGSFLAAIGGYLLAAMAYPIVLGFVAALIALDLGRFGRDLSFRTEAGRTVWLEKLPFIGIAGLTIAGTLYGRFFHVGDWFQAAGTESFTLAERITQACYLWIYYVWRPWWPIDLNPLYDTLLDFSPADPRFVVATVGVAALSVALLILHRRWPAAAALWLAHIGLLVPMLGLTEKPHYPHDRYSIVDGVLWSLALFALWSRLPRRGRSIGLGFMLSLVVAAGFLSRQQTAFWQDDITFFTRLAGHTEKKDLRAAALMKLGNAYADRGEDLTALASYERARSVDRDFPLVQLPYNHGTTLLRLDRVADAMTLFRLALKIDPDHLGALNNLAVCHRLRQEFPAAVELLRKAVALAPENPDLQENYGVTLLESGDPQAAESALEKAVAGNPASAIAHRRLAEIYRGSDRQELANQHSRIAWEIERQRQSAASQTTGTD